MIAIYLSIRHLGAADYQLGNTSSPTMTEVKQRGAWLVLGQVTRDYLSVVDQVLLLTFTVD